jgi:hypothetical protein
MEALEAIAGTLRSPKPQVGIQEFADPTSRVTT